MPPTLSIHNPGPGFVLRVYGDSLSMPRDFEGINPWQTYPEILVANLKSKYPATPFYLYNRSIGGATIDFLHNSYLNDCSYFGLNNNQIIVIQCGMR